MAPNNINHVYGTINVSAFLFGYLIWVFFLWHCHRINIQACQAVYNPIETDPKKHMCGWSVFLPCSSTPIANASVWSKYQSKFSLEHPCSLSQPISLTVVVLSLSLSYYFPQNDNYSHYERLFFFALFFFACNVVVFFLSR